MRRPEFQPCVPSIPVPAGEGRKCQPPQESLLRGDFPIYFINARRPDTGEDKRSRLQVLAYHLAGFWAPQPGLVSLLEIQTKWKGVPNRKP